MSDKTFLGMGMFLMWTGVVFLGSVSGSVYLFPGKHANGQETVAQMLYPVKSLEQGSEVMLLDGNLNPRLLKLTELRGHSLQKFSNIYGTLESVDEKEPKLNIVFSSDEFCNGLFLVDGMLYSFQRRDPRYMMITVHSPIEIREVEWNLEDLRLTGTWLPGSQRLKINLPANESNTKNKADIYVALFFEQNAEFKQYTPYDYDYEIENGNVISVRVSYKQKERIASHTE